MHLSDWRALVRRHLPPLAVAREPEIVDELAQHLADLHAEALENGRSAAEALAIAEAALPSHGDQLAADILTAGRTLPGVIADRWKVAIDAGPPPPPARSPLHGFRHDLLVSLRTLARSRGFAAIALLTLAIGIGATSAIFAAVDTMLLRPMPYPHADRLVVPVSVHTGRGIFNGSVSFADYMDWRRETGVFEAVALWQPATFDVTDYGEPERVEGARVSEEYFRLIDVAMTAGRAFVPADHEAKATRVMVISHGLWQRRFGGAADTLGKTIRLGGTPVQIIGILPPHQVYPDTAAFFIPMRPSLMETDVRERRDNMIFESIARLKDGVDREQGNAVLATIAARLEREQASSRAGWTNTLEPLRNYLVPREARLALVVLLAAVGGVLLIGCANLANLVLVRAMNRARETGLRFALGASRWRIVRLQLAESLVLSTAGAALGAGLAAWMIHGLAAIAPEGTPFIHALGLNWRVLIATIGFAFVAVLVTGVVPALATSTVQAAPVLKEGSPGAGSSRRTVLLRHALIVTEIAGAVTLLIGAALLIRSFDRVVHIDPGVDVDRVLTARVSLPGARYDTSDKSIAFFQRLTSDLAAQPGVEAAAATSFVPVGGGGFGLGRVFLAEGWPEPPAGTRRRRAVERHHARVLHDDGDSADSRAPVRRPRYRRFDARHHRDADVRDANVRHRRSPGQAHALMARREPASRNRRRRRRHPLRRSHVARLFARLRSAHSEHLGIDEPRRPCEPGISRSADAGAAPDHCRDRSAAGGLARADAGGRGARVDRTRTLHHRAALAPRDDGAGAGRDWRLWRDQPDGVGEAP